MRVLGACIAVFLAVISWPALAQPGGQDAAIDAALGCRSIADPTARLDCLDKAAAAIAETRIIRDDDAPTAETPQDQLSGFGAPVTKPQRPKKSRRMTETPEEFGAEQMKSARRDEDDRRLKKIEEKVVEVRVNSYKRATLTLANGQTWRQLDSDDFILPLRKGKLYTAVVKRGALGNYLMTIKELKRTIRVRRIS